MARLQGTSSSTSPASVPAASGLFNATDPVFEMWKIIVFMHANECSVSQRQTLFVVKLRFRSKSGVGQVRGSGTSELGLDQFQFYLNPKSIDYRREQPKPFVLVHFSA